MFALCASVLFSGAASILQGTGTGPVVRFVGGEGPASVLDAVTVTGGLALDGGGILVRDASPTILRSVVTGSRSTIGHTGGPNAAAQ